MTFRSLSIVLVVLSTILAALLFFAPGVILDLFSIEYGDAATFLARRAALLFAGHAVLWFCARNAENSPMRQAALLGIAVTMGGLACLGTAEFLRAFAGFGILPAVLTEAVIAGAAIRLWMHHR